MVKICVVVVQVYLFISNSLFDRITPFHHWGNPIYWSISNSHDLSPLDVHTILNTSHAHSYVTRDFASHAASHATSHAIPRRMWWMQDSSCLLPRYQKLYMVFFAVYKMACNITWMEMLIASAPCEHWSIRTHKHTIVTHKNARLPNRARLQE